MKASFTSDRQRISSALTELRKIGVYKEGVALRPTKQVPTLDKPGAEHLKEAYLIMEMLHDDYGGLSERFQAHKCVVDHVYNGLKKLVQTNCSRDTNEIPRYNGSGDCISRAEAVLRSLEKVPRDLLTEKEERNRVSCVNQTKAFIQRLLDPNYKPAKAHWRVRNHMPQYDNWREGQLTGRGYSRERERRRSRSRGRRRSRSRSRDRSRRDYR